MEQWLKGIFKPNSDVSSMRVMSMLCTITACLIGFCGLLMGKDLASLSMLCGTFLSGAMVGKVAQKHVENKEQSVL